MSRETIRGRQIERWWRNHCLCALLALTANGCAKTLDRIFEGPPPTTDRLFGAVDSVGLTVPQGGTASFMVTVRRVGGYSGAVAVAVERTPAFMSVSVGAMQTVGAVSSVSVTVSAIATAAIGTNTLLVRATANGLPDDVTDLSVNVIAAPSYTLRLASDTLTIARGGQARVGTTLARSNFTGVVALAASGVTGVTGSIVAAKDDDVLTISVASTVAPGTYPLNVRSSATGLSDRAAPLTLVVVGDALQVVVAPQMTVAQSATTTADVIVNRTGSVGAVRLNAERVPPGVTASFTPIAPSSSVVTLSITARSDVPPGLYPLVLRATADGVPDATAPLGLRVTAASVAISVDARVAVYQGASLRLPIRLVRQSFVGDVHLAVDGALSALTATPEPTLVSGDTARLLIVAPSNMPVGDYEVTLRATPVGLTLTAVATERIKVSIRPASNDAGNVRLDWSGCTPPSWIAVQDGTGPWQRLLPIDGVVRYTMTSGRGGFAYVQNGRDVVVRYMTQSELSAAPLRLCAAIPSAKRVTGTGVHTAVGEVWSYAYGGQTAVSTIALPEFSMEDIPPGPHDAFAWANVGTALRIVMRRDVDVANGGSIGSYSLTDGEAFSAMQHNMTVGGGVAGDQFSHSLAYLTRGACTENPLYTRGPIGNAFAAFGIPEVLQRPSDFHQITVRGTGPQGTRSVTSVMHALVARSFVIPGALTAFDLVAVPGSYKRLSFTIGSVPLVYNGALELRYANAAQSMRVSATSAHAGSSSVALAMPDFGDVPGWIANAPIGRDASALWTLTIDGGDVDAPRCTEGRTTYRLTRTGSS